MRRTREDGAPFVEMTVGVDRGKPTKGRDQAMWGLFLIGLGVVFLLARMDVIDLHRWHTWWPMLMILFGAVWIVVPGRPRQIASGVTFVLIGLWFYACIEHWYGLRFRTGWPLLVVVVGVEMVLTALLDRLELKWKEDKGHA